MIKGTIAAIAIACCFGGPALANERFEVFVEDYGPDGTSAGDTAAILAALDAAADENKGLVFSPGVTYSINSTITISSATNSVPLYVEGNGAILQAATTLSTIVELTNVHGDRAHFQLKNLVLDGNTLATNGLQIHGGQHFEVIGVEVRDAGDSGILLKSEDDYGIYYSTFVNVFSHHNGGDGFQIANEDNPNAFRTGNVVFVSCQAQHNNGMGYWIDYANVTLLGTSAERNNGYGYYLKNTNGSDIVSAYAENNHINCAGVTGSCPGDGTPDEPIKITASAGQVVITGGRLAGTINNAQSGDPQIVIIP